MTTIKRERTNFGSLPLEIRQLVYRDILVKPVGIRLGSTAWHQCVVYCRKLANILGRKSYHNEALSVFLAENMFAYSIHCPAGCPFGFGRKWPWVAMKRFRLNFYAEEQNIAYALTETTIEIAMQLMIRNGFQPKAFEIRLDMNSLCAYYMLMDHQIGYFNERLGLTRTLQGLHRRTQEHFVFSLHGNMLYFDGLLNMAGRRTFERLRRAVGQEKDWAIKIIENEKEDYKSVSWSLDCIKSKNQKI